MSTTSSSSKTLVTAVLFALTLGACGPVQSQSGTLPDTEVATILISNPGFVQIVSIDGDRNPSGFADRLTLLPGCHSLAVMLPGFYSASNCAKFPLRVEAGRKYMLIGEYDDEYISVRDLATNHRLKRTKPYRLGWFDLCRETEEDISAQCVALDADEIEDL